MELKKQTRNRLCAEQWPVETVLSQLFSVEPQNIFFPSNGRGKNDEKKVSLTIVLEMNKKCFAQFLISFHHFILQHIPHAISRWNFELTQKKCLAPKAIMRSLLYSQAIASKLLKPVTFDVSRFFPALLCVRRKRCKIRDLTKLDCNFNQFFPYFILARFARCLKHLVRVPFWLKNAISLPTSTHLRAWESAIA